MGRAVARMGEQEAGSLRRVSICSKKRMCLKVPSQGDSEIHHLAIGCLLQLLMTPKATLDGAVVLY